MNNYKAPRKRVSFLTVIATIVSLTVVSTVLIVTFSIIFTSLNMGSTPEPFENSPYTTSPEPAGISGSFKRGTDWMIGTGESAGEWVNQKNAERTKRRNQQRELDRATAIENDRAAEEKRQTEPLGETQND